MKYLLLLSAALSGCGIVSGIVPSKCEQLVKTVCDECNVSTSYQDRVCECIEEGEVANGRDYYDSQSAAELACDNTKLGVDRRYLTEEERKDCAQDLDLLKEYGNDACEFLGFSEPSSSSAYDDYYDYYDYDYDYE